MSEINGIRLAFGCQARVGKTTAVNYLISRYGGVEKFFAEPLYSILHYAQDICGFKKEKDREFLQYIGTEWARKRNPCVWVDALLKETDKLPEISNIYISDLRYPNELTTIKKAGYKTVRIIRSEAINDMSFGSGSRVHESEIALLNTPSSEWDYIIYNDGTLEELYYNLDKLIKDIISKPS